MTDHRFTTPGARRKFNPILTCFVALALCVTGLLPAIGEAAGPGAEAPKAGSIQQLRLTSASGGKALPFSAGLAFRQGDIGGGKAPAVSGSHLDEAQVVVKNRWPDGSVRFAIVSGVADFEAHKEQSIALVAADASAGAGPDLAPADLRKTGLDVKVTFGKHGSAKWEGADWDKPLLAFVDGPVMSSWVYRRPIGDDQHLVAWLEVRLYRGGAVELLPWIENGFLRRPDPDERAGDVSVEVDGKPRFQGALTLRNHQRAVLVDENSLSIWRGNDPQITFRHDMHYLQSTGLVPAYSGVTSGSAAPFKHLATSYVPLAEANFPKGMGAGGYDKSIGPLPEWDVVYMTSDGDTRAWRAVQINGYAAGRYGYHYRDEHTQRAPVLSSYPNLVLGSGSGIESIGSSTKNETTPSSKGGSPPLFKSSHMPAIGMMAYLVTGRWYFMDEMQILASAMLLKQSDAVREFTKGIIQSSAGSNTTRGAGWALRAIADIAAMTPDDDQPLKKAFVTAIENNVDWYYDHYIAQSSNPLGLVRPYSDYTPHNGRLDSASWMEDFLTWSFGNIKALAICDSAHEQRLDRFVQWKYRSIVGRLGPNEPGHWSYRQAAAYTVPYAPSESADWAHGTGPWYRDWGEAYTAAGLKEEEGTSLLGAYIDGTGLATSYWGNLQPAISYAVEQNAPGALEAYERMTHAPNWARAASHFDTTTPVWSVQPRNLAKSFNPEGASRAPTRPTVLKGDHLPSAPEFTRDYLDPKRTRE
jgi:hypothetical protein